MARDSTSLGAQWQKWYYDLKARAVELHLEDKVLVKLVKLVKLEVNGRN